MKVTKPNTKETNAVTQENFIIELFCRVDDMLPKTGEHTIIEIVFNKFLNGFLLKENQRCNECSYC